MTRTFYEELSRGLTGAIEAHRTGRKLKTTTINLPDVKKYSASDIKRIRKKAGLTQTMLASFMGLSPKTIEAWERGVNQPTGPACRLLSILEENEKIVVKC